MDVFDALEQVQASSTPAAPKTTASPDEYAKTLGLAEATGLPVGTVERNPQEAEKLLPKETDYSSFGNNLADNWVKANGPLISDDFSLPARLGRGINTIGVKSAKVAGSLAAGVTDINQGFYGTLQTASSFIDPWHAPGGPYSTFENLRQQSNAAGNALAGEATGNMVEDSLYSGIRSIGTNLPALALAAATGGGAVLPLAVGGMTSGGISAGNALDAGKSPLVALTYGASDAAVEVATEFIPVAKLLGDAKVGTPLIKMLWHQAISEVPGEQVATLLQDFNEWAVMNNDKPFSDYLKNIPSHAAETLIATLTAVGVQTGVVHTIGRDPRLKVEPQDVADGVVKTNAEIRGSKLWQRSPSRGRDLLNDLSADDKFFITAEALQNELTNATPEQLAAINTAIPELRNEVETALASGSDVAMKKADYFHYFTPMGDNLAAHIKLDPEDLTMAEHQAAQEYAAQNPEMAVQPEMLQPDNSEFEKSIERTVTKALGDAGIKTEAKANAKLFAKAISKFSAPFGMNATDVLNKGLLQFQQVDEQGRVLAQGSNFSVLLNDLERLNRGEKISPDEKTVQAVRDFGTRLTQAGITPDKLKTMSSTDLLDAIYPAKELPKVQIGDATLTMPNVQVGQNPDGSMTVNISPVQEDAQGALLRQAYKKQDVTETPEFKKWFGDSKVVDENGKPLVVYSGHMNVELYGDKYDPKKGTAGGFYATESSAIASNYSTGKFGAKEYYENGDQYRFKLKNGKWDKKIWQIELTPEQQQIARDFFSDEENGSSYDIEQYWKDHARHDKDAARALARGGLKDLQSIYKFMESMGETISYAADEQSGEKIPYFMRQRTNTFEKLLDKLGIEWQSYDWNVPGVFPLYLSIQNPLDAEKPFPQDLLKALEKKASREKRIATENDQWTKEMTLKEWVEKIKSGNEFWTTQIPKNALPILKEFGYDGIKELGMKGAKTRAERQINWIAFDPTQIKSVFNSGEFSSENPSFLKQKERGFIQFEPVAAKEFEERLRSVVISFTQSKNLSTLSHEFSHYAVALHRYFVQMAREQIAAGNSSPEILRIADDWERLKKFVGAEGDTFTVEQEEKLASAYETYLQEGNPPSESLRPIFKRFRDWLVNIYKDMTVNGVQIDDEIRGVFDRWIASEDEIAQVKNRNTSIVEIARALGMDGDIQADVDKAVANIDNAAEETLYKKISRDQKRRESAGYKKELAGLRKDVEKEFSKKRDYQVVDYLKESGARLYVGPETDAILGEPPVTENSDEGQPITHEEFQQLMREMEDSAVENDTKLSVIRALASRAPKKPKSIIEFLRSNGGIKDVTGDLKAMNPPHGLINNKSGITPDYAREAAVEAGYIQDAGANSDTVQAQSTIADLFDAINRDIGTGNVFSEYDIDQAMAYNDWLGLEDIADQLGITQKDIEQAKAEQKKYGSYSNLFTANAETEKATLPDAVAETFGYGSGIELVRSLRKLPLFKNAVEREARARMEQKYPSMVQKGKLRNEAFHAIYNSDDALVAMDILIRELGKTQGRNAKGMRLYAKAIADKQVKAMKASQSGFAYRYDIAYQKETRMALKEARAGNVDGTIQHLQKAMVNQAVYKRLNAFNDTRAKAFELFDKVNAKDKALSATKNLDFLGAARFLLHKFGLGGEDFNVKQWLTDVEAAHPDVRDDIEFAATLMNDVPQKSYKDMTVEEFRNLYNAVQNIYETARNLKKFELLGQQLDSDEITAEMIAAMGKAKPISGRTEMTMLDSAKQAIETIDNSTWRMEQWAIAIDGEENGPTTRYIVRPVMRAATEYRARRTQELQKYADILKAHEEFLLKKTGKILTPLIKNIDTGEIDDNGQNIIETAPLEFLDNMNIIGFLLHTGNESSLKKLLGGYGIDADTFWQKIRQMEKDKIIQQEHWEVATKLWNLAGSLKPEAYSVHKKLYGFRPESIEAKPITSIYGMFPGGYWPAIADSNQSSNVNRTDQEQQSATKYAQANVFQGMFKSRVANYQEPLVTNLRLGSDHIDSMLRFIYLQPATRQAARILNRKDYGAALMRRNQSAFNEIIKPWIERTVRQSTEPVYNNESKFGRYYRKFVKTLLKNTNSQIMKYNIPVALQNISNMPNVIGKTGARNFARAFASFLVNPASFIDEVKSASPLVRERLSLQAEKIHNTIDEIQNRRWAYTKAKNIVNLHGYVFIRALDHILVPLTWHAAYNKSLLETKNPDTAADYADRIVRETQGDQSPESISNFEMSHPMMKAFTPFMGFFNSQLNMIKAGMAADFRKYGWAGTPKMFGTFLAYTMPAALIGQIIVDALRGRLPEDDDKDGEVLDDWMAYIMASELRYIGSLVPFGGQVANSFINSLNKNPTDDRFSIPLINSADSLIRTYNDAKREAEDGRVRDSKLIKEGLTSLGIVTGLPLGQVSKPISYVVDVEQGQSQPETPLNYMQGLIAGPPKKK